MTLDKNQFVPCIGCGGLVPPCVGPTHRYMESSPGCWAIYGEVLAREYADPRYAIYHRRTVDAYAVQHPGRPSAQSIRSVGIHLVRLCLVLERGFGEAAAAKAMPLIAKHKAQFGWLTPPKSLGAVTAVDVWKATDLHGHLRSVEDWARSAWQAWSQHHDQVRRWLPKELSTQT
jgi:hypothetical protein